MAVVAVGGKVYAIGGGIPGPGWITPVNWTEVYDPKTNTWDRRAPMPTARDGLDAAVVGGKIYVIGGVSFGNPHSAFAENEVYDPGNDTWTNLTPAPGRGQFSLAALNDTIYALRGLFGEIYAYHPILDSWALVTTIPSGAGGLPDNLRPLASRLVFAGGAFPTPGGNTWAYDRAADTWLHLAPMPTGRIDAGHAVFRERLYVAGGQTKGLSDVTDAFEEYDPVANTWRSLPPISQARDEVGSVALDDEVYVVGGRAEPTFFALAEKYSMKLTYSWDFGDGTAGSGAGVDHAFVSPGTYNVTLTVTDPGDALGTATCSVRVDAQVQAGNLKNEAIQRIKVLKERALGRGDKEFVESLDAAERFVWMSLGYADPFEPDRISASLAADVTVVKNNEDRIDLELGPSWAGRLAAYKEVRIDWANGVVTTATLPAGWPAKALRWEARPWVDAWHQELRVDSKWDKKAGTVVLTVRSEDASLGLNVSLDTDVVASLSFAYLVRPWWVDGTHLNPTFGENVFACERAAVNELLSGFDDDHDDRQGDGGQTLGDEGGHEGYYDYEHDDRSCGCLSHDDDLGRERDGGDGDHDQERECGDEEHEYDGGRIDRHKSDIASGSERRDGGELGHQNDLEICDCEADERQSGGDDGQQEGEHHDVANVTARCDPNPSKWSARERAALAAECDRVANLLVKADEFLARTALDDAKNTPILDPSREKMVHREIVEAGREMANAFHDWDEREYTNAICNFGEAWEHSEHAIKLAEKN
jgi:PKD repeat protein